MIGQDQVPEYSSVDIVIMNPPWGFQSSRADRPLLEYGFSLQPKSMYVLHSQKAGHLKGIAKSHGYDWEIVFESNFRLPPKYSHQSRKMGETQVKCWRFHLPGDAKIVDEDE
jgi:predicted RNA methylase